MYLINAMGMTKASMGKVIQATCRGNPVRSNALGCVRYGSVFIDGNRSTGELDEYNSENAKRLSVEEIESMLWSLSEVQAELVLN